MICFCYPDCTPHVAVLTWSKFWMSLKRAAPHLCPGCSLRCMQRSVQLHGGSRARGNLALPICMLPGAPCSSWEMGLADQAPGCPHPSPAAPRFPQHWLAEMGKVLDRKCFKKHRSSLLPWGAARDPASQLTQAVSEKDLFSRSVETSGSGCSPGAGSAWAHVRLCACCSSRYPAACALLLAPRSRQYRLQQT